MGVRRSIGEFGQVGPRSCPISDPWVIAVEQAIDRELGAVLTRYIGMDKQSVQVLRKYTVYACIVLGESTFPEARDISYIRKTV